MTSPLEQWKVLPHGKLSQIDENILTVVGDIKMPLVDFPRRMTVVRTAGYQLIIFSAIALDESEMAALEIYGSPAFLIVPSDHHRLDAKIWKDRYPNMQVITPEGAREKVEQTVKVDTVSPDFNDPNIKFITVPGTDGHESALLVKTSNGTTLILNDIVANIPGKRGIGGWLLHLAGFAGDKAQIPTVIKIGMIKDSDALRHQLMEWGKIESLKQILVSHGQPIENQPQAILLSLAEALN